MLPPSALDEYMLLTQIGPAVLASVAALAVRLDDPDMKVMWESRLLAEMFGYQPYELRGQPLDVLLLPEHRNVHRHHYGRYQANSNVRTMNAGVWVDGLRKDGTKVKVQVSLYPTNVGKIDVVIAHVADVTKAYDHMKPVVRPLEDAH